MKETLNGQYTYGELYPDNLKGVSVPFVIEWLLIDGIIEGTCVDEEGKEIFDQPASIMGFIDNGIISFIKQYPKHWEVDDGGFVRVSDDIPPSEIHYSGIWIDDHFEGEWEITVSYVSEYGRLEQFDCTGTWTLYKPE